jgi:hypothetical protein
LRIKKRAAEKLTRGTRGRSYLATAATALRLAARIATVATTTTTTLLVAVAAAVGFFFILGRVDFLVTFTTAADFPFKPSGAFVLDWAFARPAANAVRCLLESF